MAKEVAAITGGTSGLGLGFVERFTKDGYEVGSFFLVLFTVQVVFCGRNEEAGNKIATENKCTFIKADVTKPEEVESFFTQIKQKFKRLDVLINNAGCVSNCGRQADIPLEEYKKIMDVNVNGAWYTLKYGVKVIPISSLFCRKLN